MQLPKLYNSFFCYLCCPYTNGCSILFEEKNAQWNIMFELQGNLLPLPQEYQLNSISTSSLCLCAVGPFLLSCLILCRFGAGNHSCCEFMSGRQHPIALFSTFLLLPSYYSFFRMIHQVPNCEGRSI